MYVKEQPGKVLRLGSETLRKREKKYVEKFLICSLRKIEK